MIEIRIHGRGGQGAVTAAEILAVAAINEGKYAQAFPSFGPERRGAPVTAFARISEQPIRLRAAVRQPNVVIVLDPSLLKIVDVSQGLAPRGIVVVNSKFTPDKVRQEYKLTSRLAVVDALGIARQEIGVPITNTTMLGAAVQATGMVTGKFIIEALTGRFGKIAGKNIAAFQRAMRETAISEE